MNGKEIRMEKELDYFTIEGSYGGSQEWFEDPMMYMGGCAAATACDSTIYFAQRYGMEAFYPFDVHALTRQDYKAFGRIMRPYLKPRLQGIRKLSWFIDGYQKYLQDVRSEKGLDAEDGRVKMSGLSGEESVDAAEALIRTQIDHALPVPYLQLAHQDRKRFRDFIWHWFLVTGYEQREDGFYIQAATYGAKTMLSLQRLWDTGMEEKGGLIQFEL